MLWVEGSGVDEGFRRAKRTVALLVLALSIGVAGALAAASFPDPVGDVKGGAGPDLTSVSVSHTAAAVTFRLRFATAPPLGVSASERWVDMLLIGIDVPPRGLKRGSQGWAGADYFVGLHGTEKTAVLVKSGTRKNPKSTLLARYTVAVNGRTLSFSVRRRKLGNPVWFEFAVAAGRETSDQNATGGSDEAPARGAFHYRLTG